MMYVILTSTCRWLLVLLLLLSGGNSLSAPILEQQHASEDMPVAETTLGKVMGRRMDQVDAFLGIPFAEAPVGKLRFRPPQPKHAWYPSLYKALHQGPECLQSELFASLEDHMVRDEDCLYLNIWRPSGSRKKLPVMVWTYGGAFLHGGANKPEYFGDQLAQRDVIMVSFNYRVGAMGFLVSTKDGLFGNYGLDDQKTALQWVQDNIESFGGDAERITLFGESAGAMSVGLHLLDQHYTPLEDLSAFMSPRRKKKLFHAVIMQSNPLGYKYRSISVANFIGSAFKEQLDCDDLKCLQSESAEELIHVQDTLMAVSIGDFFTWGPVVTDQSYYREVRLRPGPLSNITVRQPIEAMKALQKLDVPVILGSNAHEGTVFVYSAYPGRMARLIYQALVFSFFRESAPRVLKMYSYLAGQVSRSALPDFRVVLAQIIGDYLFRCPTQFFATQLTGVGTAVYLYEFALPTRTPGFAFCDGLSCHTCEIPYVFQQLKCIEANYSHASEESSKVRPNFAKSPKDDLFAHIPDILGAATAWIEQHAFDSHGDCESGPYATDFKVSRIIADYWTTFATYGDPNGLLSLASNGYMEGTRPQAPWWPRLLGDLPSLRAVKDVKTMVKESKKRRVVDNRAAASSQYAKLLSVHRRNYLDDLLTGKKNIEDFGTPSGYSGQNYMHQMIFDEESSVNIVENDCICNSWNLLEYKF